MSSLRLCRPLVPVIMLVVVLGVAAFGSQSAGYSSASASSPATTVTAISVGFQDTCVITGTGGLKCWGWNEAGQLGDGMHTGPETCSAFYDLPCSAEPVDVVGLTSGVLSVVVGNTDACALTTSGGVKCWGSISFGSDNCHSIANEIYSCSDVPVDVAGLTSDVKAISDGCAVTTSGGVKCWDSGSVVDVPGLASGVAAVAGRCALTTDGGVKCWGRNDYGQLGNGNDTGPETCDDHNGDPIHGCSPTAIDVPGLTSGVSAISSSANYTCALTTAGGVKCWGLDDFDDHGTGDTYGVSYGGCTSGQPCNVSPIDVTGLTSGVAAISADTDYTCAVMLTGGVKCWGLNNFGQLGIGTNVGPDICYSTGAEDEIPCASTPMDVVGFADDASAISAGGGNACVVSTASTVSCWGTSNYGQLGNGLNGGPEKCADRFTAIACSMTPVGVIGFGGFRPGDANCDGLVNTLDTLVVLEYDGGVVAANDCIPDADVDCDGNVVPADALSIETYSANLITHFACAPAPVTS